MDRRHTCRHRRIYWIDQNDRVILRHVEKTEGDAAADAKLVSIDDAVQKLAAAYYRIRLRLNPVKDAVFLTKLESAYWLFSEEVGVGESGAELKKAAILVPDVVEARVQDLLTNAHSTLKTEWKRVKKGEPAFYITKLISLILLIIGLVVLVVTIARSVDGSVKQDNAGNAPAQSSATQR
jgi:hypothetical protein